MELNPHWISGFVDGEGTFYVGIYKNPTLKSGYQVLPEFRIVQHQKDIQLLHALKSNFNSGVVRRNHEDRFELRIRNFDALKNIVLPFFDRYPLMSKKRFDFLKFSSIIQLMESKIHLEKDGIVQIIEIASKMNRGNKPKASAIKEILKAG